MYGKYIKRVCDLLFAIALLPFVSAVIAVAGLLIRLEDRGPVFYNSKRVGRGGAVFIMYKLRTMKVNAPDIRNEDGSTFNSATDPRLTRIGKLLRQTSIDELPQIVNIVKGEMSFVGPRPEIPDEVLCYGANDFRKLDTLPGITGYNQAFFRNSIPFKQRLKNDVYYVENASFLLDVRVILQTILVCVGQRGIYSAQGGRTVDRE